MGRPRRPTRGRSRASWPTRSRGADVFIGLSVPGVLSRARPQAHGARPHRLRHGQPGARDPARGGRCATCGSWPPAARDYPNQINNVLCFPGFFRGLLDIRARLVNDEMKLAAAHAIASCVGRQRARARVHHPQRVQQEGRARRWPSEVARAAQKTGVARRRRARRLARSGPERAPVAWPCRAGRWSSPPTTRRCGCPPISSEVVAYFDGRGRALRGHRGGRRQPRRHGGAGASRRRRASRR